MAKPQYFESSKLRYYTFCDFVSLQNYFTKSFKFFEMKYFQTNQQCVSLLCPFECIKIKCLENQCI